MKEAKRAGRSMVVWAILMFPFAVFFSLLTAFEPFPANVAATPMACVSVLAFLFCLFYAVWGLWLGNNPEAWSNYVSRDEQVKSAEQD